MLVTGDDDRHLPLDKCQQALAEMRRSKWFVSNASNLPSCVETIRIVKELSHRVSAWRCLSDWCIELLCESVLRSSPMPITMPGRAVRRVMEAVASGLLLPDGRGLRDPCERGDVDATGTLTDQQREDLTNCAQTYLRYMQFNKVHLILGMERLVVPNRNKGQQQRKSEGDEDDAGGEKEEEEEQEKAEAES